MINILSDFSLFKNHLSQLNHNRTTLHECKELDKVYYYLRIMSSDIIITLLIVISILLLSAKHNNPDPNSL